MKNHRIINIGLIIPDLNQIKDYQINLINSLKKNRSYNVKLLQTNLNIKKKNNPLFFFEKRFQKRKKSFLLNKNKFINQSKYIPIDKIADYKKMDIDIFINIMGFKLSYNYKNNIKPFWEIYYGHNSNSKYPICFDDLVFRRPYSCIKIIEICKGKHRKVIEGKFNLRNYALLHEEFILEKTCVLVIKALNLFKKKN